MVGTVDNRLQPPLSERVAAVMHYHGANMVPDLRMRTPDRNDDKQIAEVYALRDV
jgi:hypothetical protein